MFAALQISKKSYLGEFLERYLLPMRRTSNWRSTNPCGRKALVGLDSTLSVFNNPMRKIGTFSISSLRRVMDALPSLVSWGLLKKNDAARAPSSPMLFFSQKFVCTDRISHS